MRDLVDARLRKVFDRLDEASLGAPEDESLTEDDIDLSQAAGRTDRAFGVYTRKGMLHALRTYGTIGRLEARVGGEIDLSLDLEDPFRPRLVLTSVKHRAPVISMTLSKAKGADVGFTGALSSVPLVFLDGIVIENPSASFDWSRPPLPEQRRPGLSAAREVLALLILLTRRVGGEGLALVPSTFHAASLYSEFFSFVDGGAQGRMRAVQAAGRMWPKWLVAWAAYTGGVKDARGHAFVHRPLPMICTLTPRLDAWFQRTSWRRRRESCGRVRYRVDLKTTAARIPWDRFPRFPPPQPIARWLTEALPGSGG